MHIDFDSDFDPDFDFDFDHPSPLTHYPLTSPSGADK